jgi:hypothetical protein
VPVNGQLGQLTYLSRLRTQDGEGFVFHRTGSANGIDLYAVLSFSGKIRFTAYLDMYHPWRSRKPIVGLVLEEEPTPFTGSPMRLENFPTDLLHEYAVLPYPRQLAFAKPEQLEYFPIFQSGNSTIGSNVQVTEEITDLWRTVVSKQQVDEAHEPRGLIVPDFTDAEQIAPGVAYGWLPSKALAKKAKLDANELYDPVAVVVLDAFNNYFDLLPDNAGEFDINPESILLGDDGFVTEFSVAGNLDLAKDFMDFAANYWFPKRIYYLESTWHQIDAQFSDTSSTEVTLRFRWLSDITPSAWQYKEVNAKSRSAAAALFSITPTGNLVQNKRRGTNTCIVCGQPGIVWVTPNQAEQIDDWAFNRVQRLPNSLRPSVRETLINGTHEWCFASLGN